MREREHTYDCRACGRMSCASSYALARDLGFLCALCVRALLDSNGAPSCPCCGDVLEPFDDDDDDAEARVQSRFQLASFGPAARG